MSNGKRSAIVHEGHAHAQADVGLRLRPLNVLHRLRLDALFLVCLIAKLAPPLDQVFLQHETQLLALILQAFLVLVKITRQERLVAKVALCEGPDYIAHALHCLIDFSELSKDERRKAFNLVHPFFDRGLIRVQLRVLSLRIIQLCVGRLRLLHDGLINSRFFIAASSQA